MGKSSDTERELKVFVLASHAQKHLNFKKLKAFKFWQSYFSDNSLEAAFRVVYKTNKDLPPLKTGRLRKVEISGKGSKYFATFKGPYLTEFSRAEYEQEISPQVYELLLPLCQGFTIRKTRYHLPGYIYLGKNKIPVQAEIDHLTDWSDDFYTVDIEVTKDDHVTALRKGNHSFDFIKSGAVDLTRQKMIIRKALSMKFLARNGFGKVTKKAVDQLSKKAPKSNLSTK
jgi:CYTH domain-containing protein